MPGLVLKDGKLVRADSLVNAPPATHEPESSAGLSPAAGGPLTSSSPPAALPAQEDATAAAPASGPAADVPAPEEVIATETQGQAPGTGSERSHCPKQSEARTQPSPDDAYGVTNFARPARGHTLL